MIDTKLLLLEGMAGSGKSTTSRFLSIQGERNGKHIRWYHEVARAHPVHDLFKARLTGAAYESFCKTFEHARDYVDRLHVMKDEYVWLDLLEIERKYRGLIGEDAFQALRTYDTWNFTPAEYREWALGAWQEFVDETLRGDHIVLLDGSLFQWQIHGQAMDGVPKETIQNFVHQLMEIIAPLNPVLIYLYQKDADYAIERLRQIRGDRFAETIYQRDADRVYYQGTPPERGAAKFYQLLRELREMYGEMFAEAPVRKLAIDNSQGEWGQYEQQMLDFLELTRVSDPVVSESVLRNLQGSYKNETLQMEIKAYVENGALLMQRGSRWVRKLIPKRELTFYVPDLSVEITFEPDKLIVSGIPTTDAWTEVETEFLRV
jgi:thymidylate kinase